jgi:CDP-4-dehydro-6-deoxyglucose reductase
MLNDISTEYKITLKNGKSFYCGGNSTILNAAKLAGVELEHSCLKARCLSCVTKVISGNYTDVIDDMVLSLEEKKDYLLSCIAVPTSDLFLDIEDLNGIQRFDKKIVPAKINSIKKLNSSVIEVSLRLPPNTNFCYNSGQYVNISRGLITRSYSIANECTNNGVLKFFIKSYENGLMSNYWFRGANPNDLLRIEGPFGSFIYRNTEIKNIIFLATGTGVAPINAILEKINSSPNDYSDKIFWLFVGARFKEDLFWSPSRFNEKLNINYIPVLSKGPENWYGERGYIQNLVLKHNVELANSQVYACGSNKMIESARKMLVEHGLNKSQFFSDAFVASS